MGSVLTTFPCIFRAIVGTSSLWVNFAAEVKDKFKQLHSNTQPKRNSISTIEVINIYSKLQIAVQKTRFKEAGNIIKLI